MKAKLLHEAEITHPALKSLDDIQRLQHELLSRKISSDEYRRRRSIVAKAGTVIDHPEAWRLVCHGQAEPFDQECIDRVGQATLKKLDRLAKKYELLETAQLSGTPIDASDAAVQAFKATRAERRAKLAQAEEIVTPAT